MNKRSTFQLAFGLIALVLISLTGCSSLGFSKPDFSSMAFWKKDNKLPLPPPPARHVDPTRFGSETQIASGGRPASSGDSSLDANSSLSEKLEIARSSLGGGADESTGMDNSFASDSKLQKIRSFDDAQEKAGAMLTSGQQDFQKAMNSMVDDTKSQLSGAADSFDRSAYEMKRGLYDSKGRLVDDAATTPENLRARLNNNASKVADAANQFGNDFSGKLSQNLELDPSAVLKKAMPDLNSTNPTPNRNSAGRESLQTLQQEIANGKRQIEALRNQIATKKETDNGFSSSNDLTPMSMKSNSFAATKPLNPVKPMADLEPMSKPEPMAQPKPQQSFSANQFAAKPGGNASSNFSPGGALSQLKPIENDRGFNPAPKKSSNGTIYGSLAAPTQPKPSSSSSASENQFPKTSYGSFSQTQPVKKSGVGQVDFQTSQMSGTGHVGHANALEPIGDASKVSRIGTHVEGGQSLRTVGDVEIPSAILVGEGSYAPGSVNPLRR